MSEWVLTVSCRDGAGIVAAVTGALAERGDNIIESQQFGNPDSGRFFMRVEVASTASRQELVAALTPAFKRFGMTWNLDLVGRRMPTLLMVSKGAHCLVDLLYRERSRALPVDVVGVVGNHDDLRDIAEFYGKPFHHIPVTADTKPQSEAALRTLITDLGVELVVLARYMQILSDGLCRELAGRIINIHHSFLPSFKGARPYAQAHERGVKLIGATAHYVTGALDEGPIIEQDVERVDHSRTVAELQALGEDVERRALARAVQWHAQHRVLLDGSRTVVFR
ncbi:MAG: formyltetrahydrofolate deformylase [Promicromonosporaceae bacterium]|nr:formyltetrahydrofolate deformylase [Promicromonosporaceae bacterium]